MSAAEKLRPFTVQEYYTMAEAGILTPDDRVELLDGQIVIMSPIGSRHAACVNRLTFLLPDVLRQQAVLSVQNPVRLDNFSEPEPDVALLKPRADFYAARHPGPDDVLLIIEVADRSLDTDCRLKLPLYARSGIQEVWLVILEQNLIEVYRRPTPDGYQDRMSARRGEHLDILALPDMSVSVDDILG